MGYNGERASLNQLSNLFKYFEKNVASDLKVIYSESVKNDEQITKKELEKRFFYEPKEADQNIPLLSFDGGMTTLFPGYMTETCLLKIAGATSPEFEDKFSENDLKEIYFHSFVGKLNFSDPKDTETVQKILKEELNRLLKVSEFKTMLSSFEIEIKDFEEKFLKLVNKWKDKTTLKDTIRELLEWCLVVDFLSKHSKENKELPFLIIKDGNISSNPKAVTISVSNKIKELLNGLNPDIPIPFIVGAVKNSRFTGDSSLGKVIQKFGQQIPSHSFFRLPTAYEAILDKDFANQPFDRYFLSLFGGDSVYEIQIPNSISKNGKILHKVLDLIASQVTFRYGGSIAMNSFAHERASISEAEGKILETKILQELEKEHDDE